MSSVPVISMTTDRGATSTMRARKTSTSCIRCARAAASAATLIITRSRQTVGTSVMFWTCSTFTSFARCASMRRAPELSVSTTIVMRDTPCVSAWPTASDSMLKPRRRQSEATRFRTPGRSSTWTTNV